MGVAKTEDWASAKKELRYCLPRKGRTALGRHAEWGSQEASMNTQIRVHPSWQILTGVWLWVVI